MSNIVVERHSPSRDDRAAVEKAVNLLESFGSQGSTGIGVSELARRAELSKSTAFRLLGVLERNGVVEKVGQKYRLGERLHELGRQVLAPGHDQVRDALLPFMTDLYELTRGTVHLAALRGIEVVYLFKLHGHRPVPSPSRIGGRAPAHCTAVGKVLLAYDHDALDRVLCTELRRHTPSTITDRAGLAEQIGRVRAEGVAFDDQEAAPGLSCVAVPVFGAPGKVVAAMSVSGPTGRFDTRAQAASLRRVGAAASQQLTLLGRRSRG
ncbi:IclR family transcriptional regulator [Microbispora sp. NPDC046933]|uniref:IclR family transcriptional regulator n=1 Tax=Microbispora sp. NPDC046933 TaxID=3155618 RepID=UPI0033D7F1D3